MTTQTISKQHTGGVTEKKDQPESMTNSPSVVWLFNYWSTPALRLCKCARSVPQM